ncbi:MAG: ATP-binding protein [Actinomycetota bacterium]|nr:ATP-binding protein [Actinomycetota bacterium]
MAEAASARQGPRVAAASGPTATARTTAVAVLGLLVTLAVATVPTLRFAYRSEAGHLVIETCVALVGALVALLMYGRFRRSQALRELLLVHSLAVLSVAALFFVTIPIVAGASTGSAVTTWAPLLARLAGALLLLAAALVPGHRVASPNPVRDTLAGAGFLAVLVVAVALADAFLPTAVTALPAPEESGRPRMESHPVVLGVQVVNMLCFAGASAAFTLQARRTGDAFLAWLGAGCALGAWARVNYLLFPSLYSEWLYVGDVLRLGFYLLLLVGAVQEVRAYWAAQTDAAVFAERRRLARDLHDGAIQELGFLRAQSRLVADEELRSRLLGASERALDEARRALAALVAPADEPVSQAVRRAVCEVGDRYDVSVDFVAEGEPEGLTPEQREAVIRVAREAVSNAARHGRPQRVTVRLRSDGLVVEDDGRGFVREAVGEGGGFGLTSMRDRAEGIGGTFSLESCPGSGTTVEVTW